MIRRGLTLAAALILAFPGTLEAGRPEWAKPYVKRPLPDGGYIAKKDPWIAVYSELEIGVSPAGGLSRHYRQVLAPTGDEARRLFVAMDYDEATQDLVDPSVWVPGVMGYKLLDLKKAGLDVPDFASQVLGSGRALSVTTKKIEPDRRAILSWQVIDREPFPGEDLFYPFGIYPTAELTIRVKAGHDLRMTFVRPGDGEQAGPVEGELVLEQLPALHRFYRADDAWLASAFSALPHIHVRVGTADRGWSEAATEIAELFRVPPKTDDCPWAATAARLVDDAATPFNATATLAGFVQSLARRDIAWGAGAYRPEPPEETLRTRSADCKGRALLLRALLAELDIAAVPVLCHIGSNYQGMPSLPTVFGFNHVVLAIRLPQDDVDPATLVEGPGSGWVLFDPTDPLALFGQPPRNLEGGQGLWLDDAADHLFTIRTTEPGKNKIDVHLELIIADQQEARFRLTVEGHSPIGSAITENRMHEEDPERFRSHCQEMLRAATPGIELIDVRFQLPDHHEGRAARLEMTGTIERPLQPVGGDLFTLTAPSSLVGHLLGVPLHGYRRESRNDDERVELPASWIPQPCCEANASFFSARISLTLPDGWSITARPALREIDAPWLRVRVDEGAGWSVHATFERGRFESGHHEQRLHDLNRFAGLFRQPFLVEIGGAPRGARP